MRAWTWPFLLELRPTIEVALHISPSELASWGKSDPQVRFDDQVCHAQLLEKNQWQEMHRQFSS